MVPKRRGVTEAGDRAAVEVSDGFMGGVPALCSSRVVVVGKWVSERAEKVMPSPVRKHENPR